MIYYIFRLLSNSINNYSQRNQFTVTTHNLEFLKLLSKLPFKKVDNSVFPSLGGKQFFLASKRQLDFDATQPSSYLRQIDSKFIEFSTEFDFLSKKIVDLVDNRENYVGYDLYPFGNYLRKFLESFIYYKFPKDVIALDTSNPLDLLSRYFDDDSTEISRVANEKSHLVSPVYSSSTFDDIPVFRACRLVVDTIRRKDPDYL